MAELVSKRYAGALFDVSFEEKNYDEVRRQLNFVLECFQEEPQLPQLFRSPLITIQEKKDVLTAIFKDKINQEVYNFLRIIIDKGREAYMEAIIKEYGNMVDAAKNMVDAVAITAVAMNEQDLLKLQANLTKSSGKNVKLKNKVDPDVIGGVLVRISDKIIDGTIRNQLAKLEEQLLQTLV